MLIGYRCVDPETFEVRSELSRDDSRGITTMSQLFHREI